MKLKEFFKLTTVKLVITILLTILIPFVYYIYPCSEGNEDMNPYIGVSIYAHLNIECGFSLMNINKFLSISKYSIFYNLFLFFIIHILISYLLSCIVFALIKKSKPKK